MLTLPDYGMASADDGDDASPAAERVDAVDGIAMQVIRTLRLVQWGMHLAGKEPGDLDPVAFRLLATLVEGGPARLTALAEQLHTDASTVSRQTSALVKAGLIERQPDAADGRACLLAATAEGRAVFTDKRLAHRERVAAMLDDWPQRDVANLCALLERFNGSVEQHLSTRAEQAGTVRGKGRHDERAHTRRAGEHHRDHQPETHHEARLHTPEGEDRP